MYNPLMFLAPIIPPAKKLLQFLYKQALYWDDLVGGNKVKDGKNAKNYHNILK